MVLTAPQVAVLAGAALPGPTAFCAELADSLPQCGSHSVPSLKEVRVEVRPLEELFESEPAPTGGTTLPLIRVFADAIAAATAGQLVAPLAMLSSAAMSWCASEIRPFP